MSPLIRKELRLILPFWGIAMLLAVLPAFIVPSEHRWLMGINETVYWAFGFGAILLGLASFGQEFSLGTFPALLAQPFERRQMWKTKFWLVLISALLVMLAFTIAAHFRLASDLQESLDRWLPMMQRPGNTRLEDLRQSTVDFYHAEFWNSCLVGALVLLVGIAGGFWTSLLFRQTGAALWFAILIPGAILVAAEVVGHLFLSSLTLFWVPAFTIYIVAGFIWARRMFLAAQDAQWLGGAISLFNLSPAKPQTESATARRRKPVAALLRKEFQSHQISLLIAFGLLVLHLATLAIRRFRTSGSNAELWFALEAAPFLWLLIPWVIGSVAVAEERKLGTLESQLCLPATRRLQFTIKLLVTLLLGVVLGGLLPCLVEGLGVLGGVSSEMVKPHASMNSVYFASMLEMGFGAGLVAFVSFFASTLTRATLAALGAAIPIAGVFIAIFSRLWASSIGYHSIWHGPLVLLIAGPVCIIATLLLSFSNYKRLHAGRRVWLRNFLVLSISLVCATLAAAVIYQRPLELAMSTEPQHRAPRLNGSVRPAIYTTDYRTFALLPDGRLWATTWVRPGPPVKLIEPDGTDREAQLTRVPTTGGFIGGSDWVALAGNMGFSGQALALKSDGSLWSLTPASHRLGFDNDWKAVGVGPVYVFAIKTNGTLWNWIQGRRNPERVGTNSDWEAVFIGSQRGWPLLMKTNGDLWAWRKVDYENRLDVFPFNLNGADWLSFTWTDYGEIVVRKDGSLWAKNRSQQFRIFGERLPSETMGLARIGHSSNWAQVTAGVDMVALKKDGRLVKNGTMLFANLLGQPSKYSDWLVVSADYSGMTALAADGTISFWRNGNMWGGRDSLLAPSHRPAWSLNVLTDSKN